MVSQLVKDRKPTSSSPLSGKSKKQRKQVQEQGGENPVVTPSPSTMSDKALEYKLVDLLKDTGIQDGEMNAVWILIQYLARKNSGS